MPVTKTKGKAPDKLIVQNINIRVPDRSSQDISSWRQAIKSFENIQNPIRTKLYDLYTDILLDGQIEATWGKRQDAILNKEFVFINDGKEDEELTKLLNSYDFRLLVKEIHNSILWGYTLIFVNNIWYDDIEETYRIDFDLIPRKHVHPEKGFECISKDQGMASRDILFKEEPLANYMIWAGEATDMGLMVKAAQYVIYKRGGFGDWAQFAEMFGMPFRDCSYDDFDDQTRIKLEQAMAQWGAANYIIRPKGAEINIHDNANTSGSSELYDTLVKACDASISKTILGNTLTTEQGDKGARSLGEVHQEAQKDKTDSDERFVFSILNTQFRAILKRFGINATGGEIWYHSQEKDWGKLQSKWTVISGIASKIPIDDDFLYEEFDIPKPANYDELKAKQELLNTTETPLQNPLKDVKKEGNKLKNFFNNFFV